MAWWTEECQNARTAWQVAKRSAPLGVYDEEVRILQQDFHRAITRAKTACLRDFINGITEPKDVFRITKWLKGSSRFQPPPLQIGEEVYETQLDRANALRKATLERKSAADDIQDPWSYPVTQDRPTLDFPLEVTLAHIAVAKRILHQNQFGALPKRSAVDLVSCVTHDIETAIANGLVATAVTADIMGAFDAAMVGRAVVALRRQGWPECVVRFVESFMTSRMARVRLQQTTTDMTPLSCGLPQGSPLSPIVFLLYTESIYQIVGTGTREALGAANAAAAVKGSVFVKNPLRFGYADDTLMLRIGMTLTETTEQAQQDLDDLITWGKDNGVTFDQAKTEVIHFSRKLRNDENPPIYHDGVAKTAEKQMRWLGVWFDRQLSFRAHVQRWAATAGRITGLLRSIANTRNGPAPEATRRAVMACAVPMLTYASEVWYRGTRPPAPTTPGDMADFGHADHEHGDDSGDDVESIQSTPFPLNAPRVTQKRTPLKSALTYTTHSLIDRLKPCIHKSIRAVLPVWKTTPIPILHLEAAIPPADQLLEAIRRRSAARLASLDVYHPLIQRINTKAPRRHKPLRLQSATALNPEGCPRPVLLPKIPPTIVYRLPKEEAAIAFVAWLSTVDPSCLVVYSDGSQQTDGSTGYGFVVYRGVDRHCKTPLASHSARLGPAEVFDAEAHGALAGFEAAANIDPLATIYVCLDNTAALDGLTGQRPDSSQHIFTRFQLLATKFDVHTRWCPGHCELPGNEEADRLAKLGCEMPMPLGAQPTLAHVRRLARRWKEEAFTTWWSQNCHPTYERWEIRPTIGKTPSTLRYKRPDLHLLLATRSGHGDFAVYHER